MSGDRGVSRPHDHSRRVAAFTALVQPHWTVLNSAARRLSGPIWSEDVLQDALTDAWRSFDKYDPAKGDARAWLLSIVYNRSRKHWRSVHRRPVDYLNATPDVERNSDEPSSTMHRVDAEQDLMVAMERLTSRQRLIVDLYYFIDLPVEQIARMLSCSQGTVKSTLADARARLRRDLGDGYLNGRA